MDVLFFTGLVAGPVEKLGGRDGFGSGPSPWGWPSLADPSCWNTESLMAGAVPVSCTGLRYNHSATLAGSLTVDKWTRRSCEGQHGSDAGGGSWDGGDAESAGSSNEDGSANDINEVEVEMTVGASESEPCPLSTLSLPAMSISRSFVGLDRSRCVATEPKTCQIMSVTSSTRQRYVPCRWDASYTSRVCSGNTATTIMEFEEFKPVSQADLC
jgi:hypothetical protein